jgi:serine/threonine protein kinase
MSVTTGAMESPRIGPVQVTSVSRKKTWEGTGEKMLNQYIVKASLGEGSFGKVKLCVDTRTGKKVAIKIMRKSFLKRRKVGMKGNALLDVMREIAIMKKMHHPNVVTLFEVINDEQNDKLYLVLEYCEGGSLAHGESTATMDALPERRVWEIARDVLCGLDYLHSQRVMHRDLKPENLLVTADDVIKISDFGVSRMYEDGQDENMGQTAGTAAFLSPEAVDPARDMSQRIDPRGCDVWAAGVTIYQLVLGRLPFFADGELELYDLIHNSAVPFPEDDPRVSPEMLRFLKRILTKDPAARPTVKQLMADDWVTAAGTIPLVNVAGYEEVVLTKEDIDNALLPIERFVMLVKIKAAMKQRLGESRKRIKDREDAKSLDEPRSGGAGDRSRYNSSPMGSEYAPYNPSSDSPVVGGGEAVFEEL